MHHDWGTAQYARLASQYLPDLLQARDGHHFELIFWRGTSEVVPDFIKLGISPLNREFSLWPKPMHSLPPLLVSLIPDFHIRGKLEYPTSFSKALVIPVGNIVSTEHF